VDCDVLTDGDSELKIVIMTAAPGSEDETKLRLADADQASGTPAQHRSAGEAAGAEIAELAGVGHWWPVTDPHPVARALTAFWSRLDGQGRRSSQVPVSGRRPGRSW
jgi:hypothetical protein